MVDKTYIFSNSDLSSYKTYLTLSKGTNFAKKKKRFLKKKNANIIKIKGVFLLKGTFCKTAYVCTSLPNFKLLA